MPTGTFASPDTGLNVLDPARWAPLVSVHGLAVRLPDLLTPSRPFRSRTARVMPVKTEGFSAVCLRGALRALSISALVFIALLHAPAATAATLVAIVSERSSEGMAEAAQRFHQRYPQDRLVFRTSEQVDALSVDELRALLSSADALLLANLFKDSAQRVLPLLDALPAKNVIAVAGDTTLGRRSRWQKQALFSASDARYDEVSSAKSDTDSNLAWVNAASAKYPALAPWVRVRGYWQNRGDNNLNALFAFMLDKPGVASLEDAQPLRVIYRGETLAPEQLKLKGHDRVVAVLDQERADDATGRAICAALERRQLDCVQLRARWGASSAQALQVLKDRVGPRLGAIISLQDFLIGGSSNSRQASMLIEQLDVPVLKGIRLHDTTAEAWRASSSGLAWDSVYYRVSMPELQGVSQPIIVAASAPEGIDALTGLAISQVAPLNAQIDQLVGRAARWVKLQTTKNANKHLAIVYYNHPPGRHNIGADNLDVPASLLQILQVLKKAGYDTGPLPATSAQLLERLQREGVNLPEQGDALREMAARVTTVSASDYAKWFSTLPPTIQGEVNDGPLGHLQAAVDTALKARSPQGAREQVEHTLKELRHMVEGAQHAARNRALDLLGQLDQAYALQIGRGGNEAAIRKLTQALIDTGIEGLRGWGAPPGRVMVEQNRLVLPGLRFGKIFIGPQPPRGWELNEELLHANTSITPTHQYLAFYHWLRDEFRADAIIHLGRHSTYEFLPRKSVGQDEFDYPQLIAADVPGLYPYIVDGVGEGLQAKRRGLAVMIDHLTPPLAATPLYDDLLKLRQLVESFEASSNPAARQDAAREMRKLIDQLKLREALTESMDAELKVRGISFDQADDELLVHEIGHYLTHLQEDFMPLGLHVFGRDWTPEAVTTMLKSMRTGDAKIRERLVASPAAEIHALLQGLNGRFVEPGPGNDPLRNAAALPTGRNFHGLDNSLIPSRLGYQLGEKMAVEARRKAKPDGKEAVILWASDSVRDEGAMVGFGLALLGIEPVWNSRGIVSGLKRRDLKDVGLRADTLFVSSGLFRDLFGNQIGWLDKAVLLAIDGSRRTIEQKHPKLKPALDAALAPLGPLAAPGDEPLAKNRVAQHWIDETQALIANGASAATAGPLAALRVFGTAPGDYGAGINRLAERSGAWTDRKELSAAYVNRLGHAYSSENGSGLPQHALLESNLKRIDNTYLGRASNLYGLIDNNDAFDYLGGLSLAVETLRGKVPASHVIDSSNPAKPEMQPLQAALLGELRGRYLNPAWIAPLMQHGYAGARTMGSEFVEYLWGWQVTNPDIIRSWAWDEVKSVYLDDRYQMGLDKFLEQDSNVHVKTNMMAILMVAAEKGFWQADEATLRQLGQQWVDLLLKNGLPGSGHTRPDHPVFDWVQPYLRADQREPLKRLLDRARIDAEQKPDAPNTISELQPDDQNAQQQARDGSEQGGQTMKNLAVYGALLLFVALLLSGFYRGFDVAARKETQQ